MPASPPLHGGRDPRGLTGASLFQNLGVSARWLLALGAVLLGSVPASAADTARRPNIVFILADDMD